MSTKLYIQLLKRADDVLQRLLPEDQELLERKKPNKDVVGAQLQVARLYLTYGQLVQQLDVVYFQMVHPQKRNLVRKLLDLCIGRMLELKAELVTFDFSETLYLDEALIRLHLTPYDEGPGAPYYYTRDRDEELRARSAAMDEVEAKIASLEETRAAITELGMKIEELAASSVSLDAIDETVMAELESRKQGLEVVAKMLEELTRSGATKDTVDQKLKDVGAWRQAVPEKQTTVPDAAVRAAVAEFVRRQLEELAASCVQPDASLTAALEAIAQVMDVVLGHDEGAKGTPAKGSSPEDAKARAAMEEYIHKMLEELLAACLPLKKIDDSVKVAIETKKEEKKEMEDQSGGTKAAVDQRLKDTGGWRMTLPEYGGTPEEAAARTAQVEYIQKQLVELTQRREDVASIDKEPDELPAQRQAMQEVERRLQKLADWRAALKDFDRRLAELTFKRSTLEDPSKKRAAAAVPEDDDQPTTRQRRFKKAQDEDEEEEDAEAASGPTREELVAEAVLLIQRHERARQGRVLAVEARRVYNIKQMAARGEVPAKVPQKVLDAFATQIQRVWRGYSTRKKLRRRLEQERLLLKEFEPSWKSFAEQERVVSVHEHRRGLLATYLVELSDFVVADLERYERKRGPWLLEQYCDELRAWFQDWYEKCKRFPDFPDEEDGGSALVVLGQVLTPEQYLEIQELKRLEKLKTPKEREKERKEKEKQKQKAKLEKKKQKEKEKAAKERLKKLIAMGKGPIGFKPKPSKVVPVLDEANEEFGSLWRNRDETHNQLQRLEEDMARGDTRPDVEARIRMVADAMMRLELVRLEEALLRDNKGKGKKKPPKKKKKKRGGRKKKDPTRNRTPESLFEELYAEGVIRRYEPARLTDFWGEFSMNADQHRRDGRNPPGAPGDVRRVIRECCMLPMGSQTVHRLAPLVRGVCILGPRQSGKKLLVRAVCTELGAVMFDLTPENLAGKYPGKKGLTMLLHLVDKMARLLQPSILFVDGAEKMFYRRVPPEEKKLDPKRLGAKLPKIMKKVKGDDRVLLLGTSSQPWAAGPKLVKAYDRFALLPRNDYGSVHALWRAFLTPYHGVSRDIDLSGLCQMTVGYTLPAIRSAVVQTLTVERRLRLSYEPLHPVELFRPLQDVAPVTPDDQKKMMDWWLKKTPLGKQRAKLLQKMAEEREALEKEKAQAEKQKQKKKK